MSSLPLVKKLSGINRVYYWNNFLGRKILLLGESHLEEGGCERCRDMGWSCNDVDNFILKIVKSKTICLDFFIEEGLEIHPSSSLLRGNHSDTTVFKDYGLYDLDEIKQYSKTEPSQTISRSRGIWGQQLGNKIKIGVLGGSYPYLRIHKWDLRLLYEYDKSEVPKQVITRIWRHPLAPHILDNIRPISSWLYSHLTEDGDIDFNLIFDSFFSYFCYEIIDADGPRGYKSVVNSFLYTIKQPIPQESIVVINYVKKKIRKQLDKLDKGDIINKKNVLNSFKKTWLDNIVPNIEEMNWFCLSLFCFTSDIYLISRMLTKFDSNKRDIEGCSNIVCKNIVLYGGFRHIDFVNYFLTNLGELGKKDIYRPSVIKVNDNINDQCITLPRIFKFF